MLVNISRHRTKVVALSLIGAILLLAFSTGAPPGRTGAPGEASCQAAPCHGQNPEFDGIIELMGFPAAMVPGETFEISAHVIATRGMPARAGFSMVVLSDEVDGSVNFGTMSDAGEGARIDDNSTDGRTYLSHSPAKNFTNNRATYTMKWTSPNAIATDTVEIYASAVIADGNGNRSGDRVILTSLKLPVTTRTDGDMDGFDVTIDCDDTDPTINPDASEIINNDVDENCDGIVEVIDEDMDGFNSDEDCDDFNATIKPNGVEIPNNDIDENCDGVILVIDEDDDGYNSDEDCDDANPAINPGATEIANNDVDENCDGETLVVDMDEDGFNSDVDCDDTNPNINPDATDILDNGVDEDCDGSDASSTTDFTATITNLRGEPIAQVSIIDTLTGMVVATSDADGQFTLSGVVPGAVYSLSKESDPAEGLSVTDLVQITNHILNRTPFTDELQRLAADVNFTTSISATDLVRIKRVILQSSPDFGRPSWQFIPSTFTSIDDLTTIRAYKLGDVNGTAIRE